MNSGILYAGLAYILWGLLPIYWKAIQQVPASEILLYRMSWSFLFMILVCFLTKHWKKIITALRHRRSFLTFVTTALILSLNWFTYIWAVNSGYLVDASLGYFINPLLSVLLGVIFLHEKLRTWQWAAIGIAALGVLYLTMSYGEFPWIAIILAFTFGTYGLLRKTGPLGSIDGLTLEMAILFLPALSGILLLEFSGKGSLASLPLGKLFLLAMTGMVTAIPLLLFTAAAKRITLTNLGLLQYFAPTFQFLLGVIVYQENFSQTRLIGFCVIWLALIIYTFEGIYIRQKQHVQLST